MVFLVTGTGTGVGKTFWTASAVSYLEKLGINVLAFKPVETGCNPECADAKILSEASGVYLEPVYSFKLPLAPAVAGELEGVNISKESLLERIQDLKEKCDLLFIEGAGGLLVPITWSFNFLNLAKEIRCEVIVVALNKLGVINHTLLTVKCCQAEGVKVRGVILNTVEAYDESVKTNFSALKKLLPSIPVTLFQNGVIERVLKDLDLIRN